MESSSIDPHEPPPLPDLAPGRRALFVFSAWGALVAASPGVLAPSGAPLLAGVAMVLWSGAAVRPGRRAFLVEWLAAALALGGLMHWLAYISPFVVPPAGIGMGLYMAAAGALARALAPRMPIALAAALAWTSLETLRDLIEPPFGMGWIRLAHCVCDVDLLVGSARVWGPAGLSFVVVAVGASLAGAWRAVVEKHRGRALLELGCGAGALLLAVALRFLVPAPATEAGPTLLLVQPDISQARKQSDPDPRSLMRDQVILSREGQSAGPVDLVVWSETMVRFEIASPDAVEAAAAGVQFDDWQGWREDPVAWFESLAEIERLWVEDGIFGKRIGGFAGGGALLEGTSFLGGIEEWRALDGRLRRFNVASLWTPDGERSTAAKTHLVPLGESTLGFERFEPVRRWIDAMAGYTPDFASSPTSSLTFEDRAGRAWRMGMAICFDNAFIEAFPGDVDFHVVLSNEAWYRRSIELDQMIAFTRLAAAASGRAVARSTNSGVSGLIDPEGRELARLTVDGDDREVRGTLRVQVPVPSDPSSSTPFATLRPLWRSAWALLGLGLVALPRRRREA